MININTNYKFLTIITFNFRTYNKRRILTQSQPEHENPIMFGATNTNSNPNSIPNTKHDLKFDLELHPKPKPELKPNLTLNPEPNPKLNLNPNTKFEI